MTKIWCDPAYTNIDELRAYASRGRTEAVTAMLNPHFPLEEAANYFVGEKIRCNIDVTPLVDGVVRRMSGEALANLLLAARPTIDSACNELMDNLPLIETEGFLTVLRRHTLAALPTGLREALPHFLRYRENIHNFQKLSPAAQRLLVDTREEWFPHDNGLPAHMEVVRMSDAELTADVTRRASSDHTWRQIATGVTPCYGRAGLADAWFSQGGALQQCAAADPGLSPSAVREWVRTATLQDEHDLKVAAILAANTSVPETVVSQIVQTVAAAAVSEETWQGLSLIATMAATRHNPRHPYERFMRYGSDGEYVEMPLATRALTEASASDRLGYDERTDALIKERQRQHHQDITRCLGSTMGVVQPYSGRNHSVYYCRWFDVAEVAHLSIPQLEALQGELDDLRRRSSGRDLADVVPKVIAEAAGRAGAPAPVAPSVAADLAATIGVHTAAPVTAGIDW